MSISPRELYEPNDVNLPYKSGAFELLVAEGREAFTCKSTAIYRGIILSYGLRKTALNKKS